MDWNELEKFKDETGTVFVKNAVDSLYDYTLYDKDGIDECMTTQMLDWGVKFSEEIYD